MRGVGRLVLLIILIFGFLAKTNAQKPRYYFNKLFKGPLTNYSESSAKLNSTSSPTSVLISPATNTSIYFEGDSTGTTFKADGTSNNVSGKLYYTPSGGTQQIFSGKITRVDGKDNATGQYPYFYFFSSLSDGFAILNPTFDASSTYTTSFDFGTNNGGDPKTALNANVSLTPQVTTDAPSGLSGFSACVSLPSVVQTLTLSASNLKSGVTISPPTGYEVSFTNSNLNFTSSSIVTVVTSGSITSLPVYIRLKSSTPNPYNGNLTLSTSGTGVVTIALSGNVNSNNTASAASSTPTLCINTALTDITHSTTGATGIGSATGLPAGVIATWASNTITISGTPTASGTFNYSIPLTGGCGSVSATGTITVNSLPTPTASNSGPVNVGSDFTLTGVGGVSYSWSGPIGYTSGIVSSATVTRTSATITMAGIYTVSVTDGNGCVATATTTLVVNAPPEINANGLSGSTYIRSVVFSLTTPNTPDNRTPVALMESGQTNLSDIDGDQFSQIQVRIQELDIKNGTSELLRISGATSSDIALAPVSGSYSGLSSFSLGGVSYNASKEEITIEGTKYRTVVFTKSNGSITLSEAEALLDAMNYMNTASSPDGSVRRTFEITVTDNLGATSEPTNLVVTVGNGATLYLSPSTSTLNRTVTFTEGSSPVKIAADGTNLTILGSVVDRLGVGISQGANSPFKDTNKEFFVILNATDHVQYFGAVSSTASNSVRLDVHSIPHPDQTLDNNSGTWGTFKLSGTSYRYQFVIVSQTLHRIFFNKYTGSDTTGEALTLAEAEQLVDAYAYENISESPTGSTRTINFGVLSGGFSNTP